MSQNLGLRFSGGGVAVASNRFGTLCLRKHGFQSMNISSFGLKGSVGFRISLGDEGVGLWEAVRECTLVIPSV